MNQRIPPNDIEAEKSLLGSALISNQFHQGVPASAFYKTAHGVIATAIDSLIRKGEAADVSTVAAWLRDKGNLEKAGGAGYIAGLTDHAITPKHAGEYAKIVKDHSARRAVIVRATETINQAYACEPLDEICAGLHGAANDAQPKARKLKHVREVAQGLVDKIERMSKSDELPGISTGFCDLDKFIRLYPQQVTIIAGRPGHGKSALASDIARAALFSGLRVYVSSLEMSGELLVQRQLSAISGVDGVQFNTASFGKNDYGRISAALGRLIETNLWIDEQGAVSSQHIRSTAHRIVSEHGHIDLIIIDYAQLMKEPGNWGMNKNLEVSQISSNMVALSKELDTSIILLSQLSREVEKRKPPIPQNSDLRDSGSLEQDATNILFVHREEEYLKNDTPDAMKGIANIIIGKSRNGPTGLVSLGFNGPTTSFRTLERFR